MKLADARKALTAALATQDKHLIAAARVALKASEAEEAETAKDDDEAPPSSKPGHKEPDGDEEPEEGEAAESKCEGCNGTGKIKGDECETCKGTGKVTKAEGDADAEDAEDAEEAEDADDGKKALGEIGKLRAELHSRDMVSAFNSARAAGHIIPKAQRDTLIKAFAGQPIDKFKAFLRSMPKANMTHSNERAEGVPTEPMIDGVDMKSARAEKYLGMWGLKPDDLAKTAAANPQWGLKTTFPGAGR